MRLAKIMGIVGLAAISLAAAAGPAGAVTKASTYWARSGAPYYWGEDQFFVGQTGNDGYGRWICGQGEGRWWATPVEMDGSTATISAWQRVRPSSSAGLILSDLVVYNSDGSFFSHSGATTNNSLGSTTTPTTDGYADVESLFQIGGEPNFTFGCLVGVKIQEST